MRSIQDFTLAYGLTQMVSLPHEFQMWTTILYLHCWTYCWPHIWATAKASSKTLYLHTFGVIMRTITPNVCRVTRCSAGCRRVWHYSAADWNEMWSFFASYQWTYMCFSLNDLSVAEVLMQGMFFYSILCGTNLLANSNPGLVANANRLYFESKIGLG